MKRETGDHWFGDTLAVGRFSGSGHLDLFIGNPHADLVDTGSAGVVHVLRGTPNGPTVTGDQLWSELSSALGGNATATPRPSTRSSAPLCSPPISGTGRATTLSSAYRARWLRGWIRAWSQ